LIADAFGAWRRVAHNVLAGIFAIVAGAARQIGDAVAVVTALAVPALAVFYAGGILHDIDARRKKRQTEENMKDSRVHGASQILGSKVDSPGDNL